MTAPTKQTLVEAAEAFVERVYRCGSCGMSHREVRALAETFRAALAAERERVSVPQMDLRSYGIGADGTADEMVQQHLPSLLSHPAAIVRALARALAAAKETQG